MTTGQIVFVVYHSLITALGGMYGDYKCGERYMIFWKKKEKV